MALARIVRLHWFPAPVHVLPPLEVKQKSDSKLKTCVIVPDVQIGYYRDHNDKLVPIHDEQAIAIAKATWDET